MAHNLNQNNGKISFASTEKAWHGLGQVVEGAMTSGEAIKLAGLDYEVAKMPVFGQLGEQLLPVPNKFSTYRTDNNSVFGVVGDRYELVQNKDAFSFFDAIVGEGSAIFETAGALNLGERVFISAKMPEQIRIAGTDDITEMFVLLTNSHDGSGAIQACLTSVRVVCQNTLSAALRGTKNKISIRHTANVKANLEQAHKLLGISHAYSEELNTCFNVLAKKSVTDAQVKKLLEELFVSEKQDSTRIINIREAALEAYFTGVGQEKIIGTAFGVLNGLTYYFDHVKSYKNSEAKFQNIIEGTSQKTIEKALDTLIAF